MGDMCWCKLGPKWPKNTSCWWRLISKSLSIFLTMEDICTFEGQSTVPGHDPSIVSSTSWVQDFRHQHFSSSSKSGTINLYSYSIYIYYTYYTQRFQNLGNKTCKLDLGATKTSRISRLCLNPFNRKANPTYLISVISSSLPSILNPIKLSPSFPTRLL